MIHLRKFLFALMLATLPQSGHAFTATNGLKVNPAGGAVFEVIGRSRTRGEGYWCAAADFARRKLKSGWHDQVYIARTLGQSTTSKRVSAVHFTVDPAAAGVALIKPSHSLNSYKVGDHMSVQIANNYCNAGIDAF